MERRQAIDNAFEEISKDYKWLLKYGDAKVNKEVLKNTQFLWENLETIQASGYSLIECEAVRMEAIIIAYILSGVKDEKDQYHLENEPRYKTIIKKYALSPFRDGEAQVTLYRGFDFPTNKFEDTCFSRLVLKKTTGND